MRMIYTSDAPTPAGHYSQAVVHGGLVFVSGQLAVDAATGQPVMVPQPVEQPPPAP